MAPISRLDHVIVAVRNLEEAASKYRKLGFTLTPRGLHEGKGTGNYCIMFGKTYVELLGIVDETGAKGRLAERVNAQGEGGIGVAYGADDADKTVAALRAAGIAAEDPNDLARPLDLDGKRSMVKFRNVMMPALSMQHVMQFVCTHITPELTRARHEWQLHPNGATGVEEVVIAAEEPAAFRAEFEKLFGARAIGAVEHGIVVTLDNCKIVVVTPVGVAVRFGAEATSRATLPHIAGVVFGANEPDAAAAMLSMAKMPHRETRSSVIVPDTITHGVAIEFREN